MSRIIKNTKWEWFCGNYVDGTDFVCNDFGEQAAQAAGEKHE